MQQVLPTSLAIAASLVTVLAHSASPSTGSHVLESQLATHGSFEALISAADAGTDQLTFELLGFKSLDGYKNCCSDVFHRLNGTEVLAGAFNMGGGGSNAMLFNSNGGKAFSYVGKLEGLDDEAWGVSGLTIATPVPEPRAYALMLAGLSVIGFMARRRKSATG